MNLSRRHFVHLAGASAGAMTILPFAARAAGHSSDVFETPAGQITVHPVSHASFVMETPVGTIYVDPVGEPGAYADFPAPDLVLITHEHGDHYNAETLAALVGDETPMVSNPAVFEMMSEEMKARTNPLANGQSYEILDIGIDAIPAYNTTEGRLDFHPQGRDNGYVLSFEGFRVYVSGDTEDIPEMRALENIDLAFVCMNLPFTMDAGAAASAVNEFAPTYVYPYHFRGRDNGTQDPAEFAGMVDDATQVKMGGWYG